MLQNCPNHPNIKYLVCPKCSKAFKYQNQKFIELPKGNKECNRNLCLNHLKKLGSNIENRGKCERNSSLKVK